MRRHDWAEFRRSGFIELVVSAMRQVQSVRNPQSIERQSPTAATQHMPGTNGTTPCMHSVESTHRIPVRVVKQFGVPTVGPTRTVEHLGLCNWNMNHDMIPKKNVSVQGTRQVQGQKTLLIMSHCKVLLRMFDRSRNARRSACTPDSWRCGPAHVRDRLPNTATRNEDTRATTPALAFSDRTRATRDEAPAVRRCRAGNVAHQRKRHSYARSTDACAPECIVPAVRAR